ncbi:hypothetical protein ACOZ4N_12345 [Halorientalis pallida]|uniref:hypothetical protein n=1 Tax=Halorientalis pallida TaxID=2479928 RepID=UPI003C6F065C
MSARSALHTVSDRVGPYDLIAAVVLVATLERVVLAVVGPLAALVVPPVAPALVFARVAPRLRDELSGHDVPVGTFEPLGPRSLAHLVAVTTAVHAAAVVAVVGSFLVFDTVVSVIEYRSGSPAIRPFSVSRVAIVCALVTGALVWGVLGVAAVRVRSGASARRSFVSALATPITSPRRTARTVGVHLLVFGLGGVLFVAAPNGPVRPAWVAAGVVAAAVLGGVLLAVVGSGVFARIQFDRAADPPAMPTWNRRTAVTVALVGLLLAAPVVAASAVRVTETRPMPDHTVTVSDDPGQAYRMATLDTLRSSAAVTIDDPTDDRPAVVWKHDRENRRFLFRIGETPLAYASTGTDAHALSGYDPFALATGTGDRSQAISLDRAATADPGYRRYSRNPGLLAISDVTPLPFSPGDEWTTVTRNDTRGTWTVDVTEAEAVGRFLFGDDAAEASRVERARIRMTVDTDRGLVTGGRIRYETDATGVPNATRAEAYDVDLRIEVETGATVRRPAELGSRTAGEWWADLLAY